MNNTHNITIGILVATALILGALVIASMQPQPAVASTALPSSGNYVVASGRASGTSKEVVYVINLPAQRMVTYMLNHNKREIQVVSGVDLKQAFAK